MKIDFDIEVIKNLGPFRLGILNFQNASVQPSDHEFNELYSLKLDEIKHHYKLDQISLIPEIKATRDFYKKAGGDPNRYRPAADSLIRRIVKGLEVYPINNFIDILNYLSISSGFSIGGYDAANIKPPVILGIGRENENYTGIGRGGLNIKNIPVIRDSIGAFGTPTSDSERTMVTTETKEIIFLFYDFGNHSSLETSLDKTVELASKFCVCQLKLKSVIKVNN